MIETTIHLHDDQTLELAHAIGEATQVRDRYAVLQFRGQDGRASVFAHDTASVDALYDTVQALFEAWHAERAEKEEEDAS